VVSCGFQMRVPPVYSCVFRRVAAVFFRRFQAVCSGCLQLFYGGLQLCVPAVRGCVFRRFAAVCSGGLRL
jgi:hypothetical protein